MCTWLMRGGALSSVVLPLCVYLAENEVDISLSIKAGVNVVQVYGFCFDAPDGKVRIVMELCSHGSLRAYLRALPRDKVRYRYIPMHLVLCVALFSCACTCACTLPASGPAHATIPRRHLRSTDQRAAAPACVWRPAPRPKNRQRSGGGTVASGRQVV